MTTPDTLTLIRARGRRLAKVIRADGTVTSYDDAKHFDLFTMPVTDLDGLYRLLQRLLNRPDCAVVRGEIADPNRFERVRRLLYRDDETGDAPTLQAVPRWWLAVDVEGVGRPDGVPATDLAACAAAAAGRLPEALLGVECIVQASGSHGIKPDIRLRLWYWLSRAATGEELQRWFRDTSADLCVFRPAQVIYTAAPVIADGAIDPLPARLMALPGTPCVLVPARDELAFPLGPLPRRCGLPATCRPTDMPGAHWYALLIALFGLKSGTRRSSPNAAALPVWYMPGCSPNPNCAR
jgi:hypothetical protein